MIDLTKMGKEDRDRYWLQIRTEYETIGTPYRALATKWGVSFNTLQKRAVRENWVKGREQTETELHEAVTAKVRQRVVEKQSEQIVEAIEAEAEAVELINTIVLEALKDPKQFYKHLIQRREKVRRKSSKTDNSPAVDEESDRQWIEEKEFTVLDARRLKDLAAALSTSTNLKRLLNGTLSETDKQRLEMEREKLELDKKKVNAENTDKVINIYTNIPRPPKDAAEEGGA